MHYIYYRSTVWNNYDFYSSVLKKKKESLMLQYFNFIFHQINAACVRIRDFQKHNYSNCLTGSVYEHIGVVN